MLALAAASAYLLRPATLFAATPTNYLFTNSSGGSWATPGNWTPTGPANGADNTATFVQTNLAAAPNITVTLDSNPAIGNLTFSSASLDGWSLNAGAGGTLTLATSTGAAPTISLSGQESAGLQNGFPVNVAFPLAGTSGLSITGRQGNLDLYASNMYTGTTAIESVSTNPVDLSLYPGSALASRDIVVSGAYFQNVATGGVEPALSSPTVELQSGYFQNTITDANNSYDLAIGSLVLGSGVNFIEANGAGSGQTAQLSFATMSRQIGALAYFQTNSQAIGSSGAGSIGASTQNSISINGITGPTLTNGILPYAIVNNADWATYSDSLGTPSIVAYSAYQTSTDDSTWSATDNVKLTSNLTLGGSRVVNSLNLAAANSLTLDLGGAANTLTLNSGGLLSSSQGVWTIQNGNLTTGAPSGELIINNPAVYYDLDLANTLKIVDNGTTPVTMTVSGGDYVQWNSISNTYTGGTILAEGCISIPGTYADPAPGNAFGIFGAVPAVLKANDVVLDADSTIIASNLTLAGTRGIEIGPAEGLGETTLSVSGVINGPIANNGQGIGALIVEPISSSLTLKGDDTYSGGTTITSGTLYLGGVGAIPAVGNVTNNGVLSIVCGTVAQPAVLENLSGTGRLSLGTTSTPGYLELPPGNGDFFQSELQINPGSTLDLSDNTLLLNFSRGIDSYPAIRGYLQTAYNGGSWTGPGLTSSTAAANPGRYAIGYADGTLDTGTPAGANELLIQYALDGDANLDGIVNFSDLLVVAQDFGRTGQDWAHGDFNYDGIVNFSDLLVVAQNFGRQLSAGQLSQLPASFAAEWQLAQAEVKNSDVPEPAMASLLLCGAAGLLLGRGRRNAIHRRDE